MSSATATLPAGWVQILDEMHKRLDHAVALADARITQFPAHFADVAIEERRQEIAQWSDRLRRLSDYLESADTVVQSVEDVLAQEEASLRGQLANSETLRQKLAARAKRAIG
jgi:hypothetical protein